MEGSCRPNSEINGGMIKFKNEIYDCWKEVAIKIYMSQKNPSKLYSYCESRKFDYYILGS